MDYRRRSRTNSKTYIISFLGLAIICATVCLYTFGVLGVNAYSGITELTEKDLYNATNTYDVNNSSFNEDEEFLFSTEPERREEKQYHLRYNMTQKNANDGKVMESAQITVLTHGLGSDAGTWSNHYSASNQNDSFAYDPDPLINRVYETTIFIDIDLLEDCDFLYIRCGAHGNDNDRWQNDYLYLELMYTATNSTSELDDPEFYWHYQYPFD